MENPLEESIEQDPEYDLYDESMDDIIDNIAYEEYEDSEDGIDGKYYIGMPCLTTKRTYLMGTRVRPITFFTHSYLAIHYYLSEYNLFQYNEIPHHNKQIHIMKLTILHDGTYTVVLKTHWLRLIQRKWRSIMQYRKQKIQAFYRLNLLREREIRGRFPSPFHKEMPLQGMMSNLCISV